MANVSPPRPAQKRARADTMHSCTSAASKSSKTTPVKPRAKRPRAQSTADTTRRDSEDSDEEDDDNGSDDDDNEPGAEDAEREVDNGARKADNNEADVNMQGGEEAEHVRDAAMALSQQKAVVTDVFAPRPMLEDSLGLSFNNAKDMPLMLPDANEPWPYVPLGAGPLLRILELCWPSSIRYRAWLVRKPLLKELMKHRSTITRATNPLRPSEWTSVNEGSFPASLGLTDVGVPLSIEDYKLPQPAASQLSRIAAGFVFERLATMEAATVSILKTLYWTHVVDSDIWDVPDDLFAPLNLNAEHDFNDLVVCVLAYHNVVRSKLEHFVGECLFLRPLPHYTLILTCSRDRARTSKHGRCAVYIIIIIIISTVCIQQQ